MAKNVSGWNYYKEPVYEFHNDAFTFVMGVEFILKDKPSRKFKRALNDQKSTI